MNTKAKVNEKIIALLEADAPARVYDRAVLTSLAPEVDQFHAHALAYFAERGETTPDARRKFEELLKNGHASPVVEEAIRRMGWIFWIEKQARNVSPADRLAIRQEQTRGHWDKLHEWLRTERALVPDSSAIAAAINYSLNRWTPLGRFLEDGNVSCHNNHLENLMRPGRWDPRHGYLPAANSRASGRRRS